MSWLLTTATAEEARAKSGLNWQEWAKFYVCCPSRDPWRPAERLLDAPSVPV